MKTLANTPNHEIKGIVELFAIRRDIDSAECELSAVIMSPLKKVGKWITEKSPNMKANARIKNAANLKKACGTGLSEPLLRIATLIVGATGQ